LLAHIDRSICQEQAQEYHPGSEQTDAGGGKEFAIPVRIIPGPSHEQHGQSDADKAQRDEEREDENLAAQRSIAESSEKVGQYAAPMFYVGTAGFLLSLATVFASFSAAWFALGSVREARKATQVAQRALATTEDTAKKQLRAYLVLDGAEIPQETPDGMLYAVMRFKNCGQTPATITHVGHVCFASQMIFPRDLNALELRPYTSVIGGGSTVQFHAANTLIVLPDLKDRIAEGKMQIAVRIAIRYTDIYGDEHSAQFTRTIEGARNLHGGLGISQTYPDMVT
jgi:hypothetical protein